MNEKSKPIPVTDKKTGQTRMMSQKKDQQNKKPYSNTKEQSSLISIEQEQKTEAKQPASQPITPSIEPSNLSNTTGHTTTKKQQQIESLADFLRDFYRTDNKKKSLSSSILSRLQKTPPINEETRKELLEIAKENDPTLEKSLCLITQATNLDNKHLKSQLCFFAAETGRLITSKSWLPIPEYEKNGAQFDLKQLFEKACSEKQKINDSDKEAKQKKEELKKLENIFYLACQWYAFLSMDIKLSDLVDNFYQFFLKSTTENQDSDKSKHSNLIQFFSNSQLFDNKEPIGLGWLISVQKKEIEEAKKQSAEDEKRVAQAEKERKDVNEKLDANKLQLIEKEKQICDLEKQIGIIKEESRIQAVHLNDDLSRFRGKSLKFFDNELPLIQDVLTALERDPPKIGVAREYLSNIIEKMSREIARIKEHQE